MILNINKFTKIAKSFVHILFAVWTIGGLLVASLAMDVAYPALSSASTTGGNQWQIQQKYLAPADQFNSVSCPSSSTCIAVGGNSVGGPSVYETTDGGSTWSNDTGSLPSGLLTLTGVSCTSQSFCEAVGDNYDSSTGTSTAGVLSYNGATWSSESLPSGVHYLNGVSCTSQSFCEAVGGNYDSSTGTYTGGALSYNGATWSSQSLPSGVPYLNGVSCTSQSFCEAVGGNYGTSTAGVLSYNGSTWSSQSLPPSVGDLYGVSCVSTSFCEAVGGGSSGGGVALSYNGTSWSSQSLPSPSSSFFSTPISVSCVSASFCMAVDNQGGIALTYNGTSWSSQSGPASLVSFVSCASASFCEAVWGMVDLQGGGYGYQVTDYFFSYNGSTWSSQSLPSGVPYLNDVSCTSQSFCEAVGNSYNGSGNYTGPALLSYNGSTWSSQSLPSGVSDLYGVSCTSASFCEAVGSGSSGLGATAIISYNGSTWSSQSLPSGVAGGLNSVSCTSQSFCEAVGLGVALSYQGSTWSLQSLPSGVGELNGVSCTSQSFCEAVGGNYDSSTRTYTGIAISYNGATWSSQSLPTGVGQLNGVSCVSQSFCEAVGNNSTANNSTAGVALTYQGSTWSTQSLPSGVEGLSDVSCTSQSFCEALGVVSSGGIALSYNGSTWSSQSLPSGVEGISGVSCTSQSFCEALGSTNRYIVILSTVPTAPTLSSISPTSGPASGGTTVTLTGSGFSTAQGGTTVLFGSTAATSVSCSSTTSCSALSPPAPSGATLPDTVQVSVTVSSGTSDWMAYTYLPSTPQTGTNYYPLVPYRICDSRTPKGSSILQNQCNINGASPIGANQTLNIEVSGYKSPYLAPGETPVPTTASAVVLNITAIDPTASGYLTVWPAGEVKPTASLLNYTSGETVPNLSEVALGTTTSCTGCISIYSYASSDVVVDVEGYYGPPSGGATFSPITPYRICDTRVPKASSILQNQCNINGSSPVGAKQTLNIKVSGYNSPYLPSGETPVPTTASAVVLNVTAIDPTTSGYLTVWPEGLSQPTASNLNFRAGQTVPNAVVVPLSTGSSPGEISIYNFYGNTDVTVDVTGYFSTSTTGVSFVGTAPYRACDTRDATMVGYATPCSGSPLVSSTPLTLSLAGIGPIPSNAKAVVVNVTAINPTASGYITVWPEGLSQPTVSNLNFVAGEVVANSVTVALSASGDISIGLYQGSANLVVDVTGWYV
ncbi:MAG: IPT/TIG domain-containing protein [Actinobacteria bacterium]|nr:IPT/TIG domain-containing protein [Actinomycetota bacterium]